MDNDILCLTVTHVSKEDDVSDIIEQLASFEVHLNSCNDKFQILDSILARI